MERKRIYRILLYVWLLLAPVSLCATGVEPDEDSLNRETPIPLFQRIEKFALRDNIISRIVRSFLVMGKSHYEGQDTIRPSDLHYESFQGKYIRRIDVIGLDPFGYSVGDTYMRRLSDIEIAGNIIHYPTRGWIIRNHLLFREGSRVDPYLVSESERLIRQDSYILDARINMHQISPGSDTVDVLVVTQDVFNYGVGVSADPKVPNGNLTLQDINFLGLGHTLENKLWYDPKYYKTVQYSGRYFLPDIGRSFFMADLHYYTKNWDRQYGISINRPFYSSTTHWAGGLSIDAIQRHYNVDLESRKYEGNHQIQQQDGWIGYAITPGLGPHVLRRKTQFILSTRLMNVRYVDGQAMPGDLRSLYPNQVMWLGAVGYSFREYYKDRFIFGFGKTEDIPLGYLFVLTGGEEFRNSMKRPYAGIKASYGTSHSTLGYIYTGIEAGGFIQQSDFHEASITAQMLYFTFVHPVGNWKMRQYLWNRFTFGYNRVPGQIVTLNQGDGIRGITLPFNGTQRWVTNYELDMFMPYRLIGFRAAAIFFADFGLLGTQQRSFLRGRLQQGYGIGLRMKNEHLIFSTFQVSLNYYPDIDPAGDDEFMYYHSVHTYYRFQDFQFSQPYTAPY